jgi:hypothetical protein
LTPAPLSSATRVIPPEPLRRADIEALFGHPDFDVYLFFGGKA